MTESTATKFNRLIYSGEEQMHVCILNEIISQKSQDLENERSLQRDEIWDMNSLTMLHNNSKVL